MTLAELPLFFLDLQTTGSKPDSGAHILEMAWSSLNGDIESTLVQLPADEKIPYRIQIITGIFNEDMEAAVPVAEVFSRIENSFSGLPCVIHFAQFEKPFLAHAYEQLGKENSLNILCTHEIAKRLFPNLPTRGIKGLAGYFGFPSSDLKRSAQQVAATKVIWKGLVAALAEQGIHSYEELQQWLQITPKGTRTKYEYPLPKEKRLSLPDQPGVYRMVSKWDEVLYVGKATSLKDRVNSYFRGQKNRDPRKLEMLTQTYDLRVTVCGSPLEAALLETDEIKRLDPKYNISLKAGQRSIVFFNRDLTDFNFEQNEEYCFGPFSNPMVFDSIRNLSSCLIEGLFHDNIFYEPVDGALVESGFGLFCERNNLCKETFKSVRSVLAQGLWWNRQYDIEEEEPLEEAEGLDAVESAGAEELDEVQLTAEDIADKFERHFMRAGRSFLRAKQLTRILNADIDFHIMKEDLNSKYHLKIRKGFVNNEAPSDRVRKVQLWNGLDIDTYDRMSVLLSELNKIETQNGEVKIQPL
ncbi:exonuclease domain-containing protein [Bdellovibrio svalbardensis]|uniref:Excinuclease cho n=1 Tax=Bdellovibrio svalbardensis TaxID=2972972 RepID=A0ABT6DGG2_9BACT|nr:exonuclease domain-containing protein [Bdellovibrio svalbardensis]MDG0814951.1 GIY-YIG nuclease family protein [Bdellovibrio svalbardensis]